MRADPAYSLVRLRCVPTQGLGPDMTLEMLRSIFAPHGTIVQLKILCRQQKKGTPVCPIPPNLAAAMML